MLLWCEINVNTAHCEHPCNSLHPFQILWMIILGSGQVCVRIWLFLKHLLFKTKLRIDSGKNRDAFGKSQNRCGIVFSFRDASIYFPSPNINIGLQKGGNISSKFQKHSRNFLKGFLFGIFHGFLESFHPFATLIPSPPAFGMNWWSLRNVHMGRSTLLWRVFLEVPS